MRLKMNILLINHYAGSPDMGMEFRPYYMAREWIKEGHRVFIIAGDYSHLRKNNPVVNRDFEKENINGIHYIWIKTGTYDGNGVKRAVSMARFVSKLWIKAERIAKGLKPDVVIASSTYPLDTYIARRIRYFSKASYIHEIHDMWPVTLMELSHMPKFHPFIVMMQIAENSFCKYADQIVSLPSATKDYLMEHGMAEEKFVSITNGICLDEWENKADLPKEHESLLRKLKGENKFIIGFFGSHTKSYALTYLIDALREIQNNQVCAVLVGDGIEKKNLMQYASDIKDRVYFLPLIEKRAIPALVAEFDAIYVGALNNRMFRFGISMNKLFDAMMSEKPVLYAVNAPNNYIEEYHCGISVEPENVSALKTGIQDMLSLSDGERTHMGRNGKKAVLENFQYGVLAKRFLNEMGQLRCKNRKVKNNLL